ncbi:restriction endonuclease subunit S [Amycolatopsis sp. cmx-4-68]|uniref:restriction endonuclease subunit S n=1 Tax=Amycolatopsis sp. cmx-4-68 TaxID=2790938 RepID=UPI00397CEE66
MNSRLLVLGDALELLIDNRGKNPPYEQAGIPVISGMSVRPGYLDLSEPRFASKETWARWMPYPTQPNDVVLTSEAPLGRVALIRTAEPLVIAQRVFCLRGRKGVLDSRFLYYALQTDAVQGDLRGRATGTTVLGIRQPELRKVLIPAPDYKEQLAIAEILGAVDDKIAANEYLITKADELASVKWTSACDNGSIAPLSSLARFVNGKAFTKGASGTGRIVIRIAELNSGIGPSTVYNDINVPDDHLAHPGDLLFAWSGSLTVARWFREEAIVNQHIFKVIPTGGYPTWLVNQALREKLQDFKSIAADKATTMGHIQRRHLDELVTIPIPEQVDQLDRQMSTLWQTALSAEQENLQLESTRDQLLPLLMSGRVHMREAEKIVEEVV